MFVPKKALGQVVPCSSVGKLAQRDALASTPREAQARRDASSQHLTGYLPFTALPQYITIRLLKEVAETHSCVWLQ